jgi:hypothetical protein
LPVKNRRYFNYDDLQVLQLEFEDGYRKNVPQSEDYWFSLNIRPDGTEGHIYEHEPGGREINKDNPIYFAPDCLYENTLDSGEVWSIQKPESMSTCVCTAFYLGRNLNIEIESENDLRKLIPNLSIKRIYLVFLDKEKNPIPRNID